MVKKTSSKKPATSSKPATKRPARADTTVPTSSSNLQSIKNQQRLLNVFSDAFQDTLTSDHFSTLLQEIKQALFNRDFAAAFGREDHLEAYAARWSPTRALCYASVLSGVGEYLDEILISAAKVGAVAEEQERDEGADEIAAASDVDEASLNKRPDDIPTSPAKSIRMVSIGGCAAEHLAFASYLDEKRVHGSLTLLDSAPWISVVDLLQAKITSPPPLSKYASAAAKASNRALLSLNQLNLTFTQQDILALDTEQLSALFGPTPALVTMLFTLNELYTNGGIAKTTRFLKNLGQVLTKNSLVLVVDSPGSYSEAALGKEKKRYPMQWLLDHTLLETDTPGYKWEKLESQESFWFRLPDELSYPIPLENMRYQLHLYRLSEPEDED